MSRKYKFHNEGGVYFVSFATIKWMDVFVREEYSAKIIESLNFCIENKGMVVYCWCIMPSHVHLIFSAEHKNPSDLMRDFKTFTSKQVQSLIEDNPQESRKEWMLAMMEQAAQTNSNVDKRQFWQQHNQPIELWSKDVLKQKMDYIHNNPVAAGFINDSDNWRLSSAVDYCGGTGFVKVTLIE